MAKSTPPFKRQTSDASSQTLVENNENGAQVVSPPSKDKNVDEEAKKIGRQFGIILRNAGDDFESYFSLWPMASENRTQESSNQQNNSNANASGETCRQAQLRLQKNNTFR